MSDQEYPLPPATLEFLVLSLKTQAEMHLGMFHLGDEKDRPEPDFRIARHTIDLLAMLQDKTRGNVTIEEQRLLDNGLTELRFRFVQAMERRQKAVGSQSADAGSQSAAAAGSEPGTGSQTAEAGAGSGTEPEGQAGA